MTFYEQPFYDDDVIMTSQGRFQIFLTPPVHVPYFNLSTLKVSKLYLKKCRSRPVHQFVGYIYHYHYLSLSIVLCYSNMIVWPGKVSSAGNYWCIFSFVTGVNPGPCQGPNIQHMDFLC